MNILAHKTSGIYAIVNRINGKIYVGSAVNIQERWCAHKNCLRRGVHANSHLQNAWNKYGAGCFTFSVLEYCDKSTLIQREQIYLDNFQPQYNIYLKAGSPLGTKHSEEHKRKIAEGNRGKVVSDEARQKLSEARKGIVFSEEHRRKLSEAAKGRVLSAEVRRKMSEAQKGKVLSDAHKRKLSVARKGMVFTEEHRRKLSEAARKRIVTVLRHLAKAEEQSGKVVFK